jgi:outer membrane protein assembly factor BamD (BamD/ComL family)
MVKLSENNAYKRGQELLDSGMYKEAVEQFDLVLKIL